MSGLLAFTYQAANLPLPTALRRLARLGGESERVWTGENTVMAVTRKSWETEEDFSGPALLLEGDDLVVAADAAIYDRSGLSRALSMVGVEPRGTTASHLIEAAYRAWGTALVDHLVGDYAFIIWDRKKRTLVSARDPYGSRALFFAPASGGVAVSSSSRALAELHGRASDLNLDCIAAQVAGLVWSLGTDTCFRGVYAVRPGHLLIWQKERLVHERFWHPASAPSEKAGDFTEAAAELRSLLRTAVDERLGSGPSAVWMSGGWDSTAVFGAGQLALMAADRRRLRPVSISFPEDDPAREDDFIQQVACRWNASVHWLQGGQIQLLEALNERAAASDEPSPSLFESAHRALGRGTRAAGARVALDGSGGDQLFAVSDVVLADLLRTGHWVEFVRFVRSRRLRALHMLEASVRPHIPQSLLRATEKAFGRRIRMHYLERPLMRWVPPAFVQGEALLEREVAILNSMRGTSISQTESIMHVTAPFWGFCASSVRRTLLEEGVDLRSPLMDRRVVEFALSRPVSERASHSGTKLLLRKAMEGLIPQPVLAPREYRTGTTERFSRQQMEADYPRLFADLFERPLRLADLGVVEPKVLWEDAQRFLSGQGDGSIGAGLFNAMSVELWLRGLDRSRASLGTTAPARRDLRLVSAA